MGRFLGPAGITVIKSELLWVWLPCVVLMLTAFATRRQAKE